MARHVFLSARGYGHVNPTIAVVQKLCGSVGLLIAIGSGRP